MFKHKHIIKDWLIENSEKKIAIWTLRAIAFTESSFFPIPADPFLAGLIVVKSKKWLKLTIDVILYSVLGGVFGYLLGFWFFDFFGPQLISFYGLEKEFILVEQFFVSHAFWSTFLSAFTPIPYKVFTIGAGLFSVNFFVFLTASIIGRGLRFLIVGVIFRYIGEKYSDLIFKYFNWASLFAALIIIAYLIYKFI